MPGRSKIARKRREGEEGTYSHRQIDEWTVHTIRSTPTANIFCPLASVFVCTDKNHDLRATPMQRPKRTQTLFAFCPFVSSVRLADMRRTRANGGCTQLATHEADRTTTPGERTATTLRMLAPRTTGSAPAPRSRRHRPSGNPAHHHIICLRRDAPLKCILDRPYAPHY